MDARPRSVRRTRQEDGNWMMARSSTARRPTCGLAICSAPESEIDDPFERYHTEIVGPIPEAYR